MRNHTQGRQPRRQGCAGTALNVLLYIFAFTMMGLAIWSTLFPMSFSAIVHGTPPGMVPTAIIMSPTTPATPRNADPPAVVAPAVLPVATPATPRNDDTAPVEAAPPVVIPPMEAPPVVEAVPPAQVMSEANEEWLRTLLPEHSFPPAEPEVTPLVEEVPPAEVSSSIHTEFACTKWGICP